MNCPHCGSNQIKDSDNFCGFCGTKLRKICNCWIKKDSYDCGRDSCPGRDLLVEEAKGLKISSQAHTQSQLQIVEEHQQ